MARRTFSVPLLLTAAFMAAAFAVAVAPAGAHEHVHVGDYELTVGWVDEPPIVGSVNGLDLGIKQHLANNTTAPVLGADATLTVTLSTGGASTPKVLEPQFGRPGYYTFDVIPTREGAYAVRVVGTVNGTAVNATVDLASLVARSDIEFPVAEPTPSDLAAAQAANATAQQATIDKLQADNSAMQAQASAALMVGLVGLLAGVAGVAVGALAMRRGKAKP